MKNFSDFLEGRCWPGHKPVPGKKPFSPGSCMKEDDMEEDWTQKYKSSIDCDNPKGFSQKAHCAGKKKDESVNEDLRNWFDPNHPKGGWKRVNSKGEVVGDCAREPGEPKPKCMSNAQRASLSKKEKASAVRRKRKEDPNPERQGEPINVKSKVNENMEQLDEKNKPTNPELWARAIAQAKSKFDVYPSAYANGWASKWYKEKGGGWKSVAEAMEVGDDPVNQGTPEGLTKRGPKTVLKKFKELSAQVNEAKDEQEYGYEGDMALNQLATLIRCGEMIQDMLKPDTDMPEWVQSKITLATDYIQTAADYLYSEMKEEVKLDENAPFKKLEHAVAYATDKVKTHRDNLDGIEVYKHKAGGYDVNHTMNANGRNSLNKSGAKHLGTVYKDKPTNIKEEVVQEMDKSQTPPGRDGGQGDAFKKEYAAQIITPKKVVKHGQNLLNKILKPKEKIKEAFRPMDEPNYNNSIQARQKKADDNKPPFDGPYKKTTGVVTDKSGAKHGGMSIARHLAKQAAKKQAGSIKEEKQKSRKAQIIKDASKGKDKFEKDPIITDTTTKTDNLQ